jgi:hypothetical protein
MGIIRGMPRLLLPVFLALFCATAMRAQSRGETIACYAERGKSNSAYTRKLWDGYEVSLGPARNGTENGDGDNCTAAIYNRAVKVVYRTTGYSVVFDEDTTGEDLDDDGHPEVVFKTDTGGGNHCCWSYNVVSLWPRPHKLVDIPQAGAVVFRKDEHGKIVIWVMEPGPYGYTSMAENPFAQKIYRLRNGKLLDVTPDYCGVILREDEQNYAAASKLLTPERTKEFKSGTQPASYENSEMASAVLTVALQHVFCHQFDQALADLELWPDATKSKMKADFANSIRPNYPDFAARLTVQAKQPIQTGDPK